jgi:[acyl-carrier-protein] S-malonyltransferase
MAFALTFPGQGSQQVGMGRALAEAFTTARDVFGEVDEALSQKLSRVMWEGPEEELTLTENAQPALMAVSMAVMRVLERDVGASPVAKARFVAGHSLGEYSALAAAGTFSLADTARLLKIRGRAMQLAVPVGEGAMAALLGLEIDDAAQAATAGAALGICQVANDNAPGQIVISGARVAVERAVEVAKEIGAKRAIMLPVSAPFHCALMQPAADAMAGALADVEMTLPAVPLVANVTASHVSDPATIRDLLVEQVTGMVRWRESVAYMVGEGVDTFYEIGAGKVLSGLARRIDREVAAVSVATPDDVDSLHSAF